MEWLIIMMLICVGGILLVMEFLIFPGINVVGVVGFCCILAGIVCGYSFYDTATGHLILLVTAVAGFLLTCYVLRSNTWKKLSLPTQLEGTVEGVDDSIQVGDLGTTLGRLAPMGNVQIRDIVVEAESQSGYIDSRQQVEVVKIYKNKIVVKLKK